MDKKESYKDTEAGKNEMNDLEASRSAMRAKRDMAKKDARKTTAKTPKRDYSR
jgi:hypothetical protein